MRTPKDEKLFTLAKNLLRRTEENLVTWKETSSEDRFYAPLKEGGVEIERIEYQPNELAEVCEAYRVNVLNQRGRVVDAFSPEEDEDGVLLRLFRAARSAARGGEQLVDKLLEEIEPLDHPHRPMVAG